MWGHRYTSDDERALIGARHGDPEGVQVLLRRVVSLSMQQLLFFDLEQCDQIGRFLKVIGDQFSFKSNTKIW